MLFAVDTELLTTKNLVAKPDLDSFFDLDPAAQPSRLSISEVSRASSKVRAAVNSGRIEYSQYMKSA